MKKNILLALICLIPVLNVSAQTDSHLKLWYAKPANAWVEALPIGNGRLGAMVYGDPSQEIVQLNESTVWAGQPNRNDNPDAKAALPKVQELIFAGKYKEAQDLANQSIISKTSHGMPYQTVGNLKLHFPGHDNYVNYYRELDLENAITRTRYELDGVTFHRQAFASFPDQVIVLHLNASEPGNISFTAGMDRPDSVDITTHDNDILVMSGVTGDHETVTGAVKFQAHVKIVSDGGEVIATDSSLVVSKANSATLYISIATNFKNYHDISADAGQKATLYLQKAIKKEFEQLLSDHIADYQTYFNRVSIDLGITDAAQNPTDVRIDQFADGDDPQLAALYFQFGRYLLISSSRPGGQPATLQGLWNDQLYPPWDSKYTVNINTEMNYWPSETTNLTEMNEPLIQMVRELAESGMQTARVMYGQDGWVLHHNTDIWRINGPIDGSFWGMWPMASAWLCQHLYEKYLYHGDLDYLASVYPVMKSAVEFYLGFLIEEPEHQWLVASPSVSPENAPAIHPDVSIAAGTTMDNQLLFDLFTNTIRAAELLQDDKEFIAQASNTLHRLAPMQIGQHGQLQEWLHDWDNPDDHHRHVSHLYGVFPSNQISPFTTPELFDAARTSLLYRGDPSTGWSMNWKINLWAHFLDGNHAYKLMTDQISLVKGGAFGKGGTYPNMFDAHPPFQIDGNFGFTSGVAEMLLQSDDGDIFILPALPDVWSHGSISGLCARGGFVIEKMTWENGRITKLVIKSNLGGNCRIRSYSELQADASAGMAPATGENPNAFYRTPEIKQPLISAKAGLNNLELPETFVYDIQTRPGEVYTFSLK